MENTENGRRLPPDVLPLLIVGELRSLGRTATYAAARDGTIPTLEGTGRLKLVRTNWVLEQHDWSPEELAERLPPEAWDPPRKRAKGGRPRKKEGVPS